MAFDKTGTVTSSVEVIMLYSFDAVQARLEDYVYVPDKNFKLTSNGFPSMEASLAQKSRQYWADKSISNEVKLDGLDFDLSEFDPENTTTRELMALRNVLEDLGIIDPDVGGIIGPMNCDFNAAGHQTNFGKKIDAFACLRLILEDTKKYVEDGHGFAKGVLVSMNTALAVMLALKERAAEAKANSLIDTRV
jgi:hypothetical protein